MSRRGWRWGLVAVAALMQACGQAPPANDAAATAAAVALIGNVQGDASRDIPPDQFRPASGERPQLDAATASRMDVADYLAQGPAPWAPEPLDGRPWRADLIVASDGSGSHRSLQAAIDAVPERSRQVTHPHPSFTPDDRAVLFSADGEREPGLYLAELGR